VQAEQARLKLVPEQLRELVPDPQARMMFVPEQLTALVPEQARVLVQEPQANVLVQVLQARMKLVPEQLIVLVPEQLSSTELVPEQAMEFVEEQPGVLPAMSVRACATKARTSSWTPMAREMIFFITILLSIFCFLRSFHHRMNRFIPPAPSNAYDN
jgi:hypothetical protein